MATEGGINQTLIADAIGGSGGSSDDIRKRIILAMLQEGTSGAPVQHWLQGFDRVGKALLGSWELRDLDRSDRANMQRLTNLYLGGQPQGGGQPAPGPTRDLTPAPQRSASLPAPPTVVPNEPPPPNPPGTFPTPKNMTSQNVTAIDGWPVRNPAQMAQALRGGSGVNLANIPGGPGSPEDMGPPLRPPSGAAALAAPMPPRPDPAMALQPPAESAGVMPPGMPPGQPPAGAALQAAPPGLPAPREQAQVAPAMTPERRRALVEAVTNPRTPAAFKALFAKQLNPKIELKEINDPATGEKVDVWVNTDTQQVLGRVAVPGTGASDPGSSVPQPPPGMTPGQRKIWNTEQAKRAAEGALPASDDNVHKLRQQFLQTKEAANMESYGTYRSMMTSAGANDRAADLNITAGLAKILDPTGVVREGDIIMVQNTQAIPNWLLGQIQRLNGGGGLQPVEREKIMAVAYSRMKEHYDAYENRAAFFRDIARDNRMNPAHVVQSYKPPEKWTKAQSDVSPADLANEILRRQQKLSPHLGGGR